MRISPDKPAEHLSGSPICHAILVSGVHRGGAGRAQAPAPLRSDTKVPLRSGLCDMNDIVDDKNQYRRSLYAEYAVCIGHQLPGGAPSQLLKKKKNVTHHFHIRARNRSRLIFAAECRWS